jgi:uncharacterized protein (DUF302 family)
MTAMRRSVFLLLLLTGYACAEPPVMYVKTVNKPIEEVYARLYKALEEQRFWVAFEVDMAARMARFRDKWGEDYNRNGLSGIRSMVFCNIWWTNRIANADPDMVAMCPLHISLYERAGSTSVVFPRPSALARGSKATEVAEELESELIGIIDKNVK